MRDPQKPDPNFFWCPKCRAHGKYDRKSKSVSTDHGGSRTITTFHCKECEAEGGKPLDLRDEACSTGKIILWAALGLEVLWIILGLSGGHINREIFITILVTPIACLVTWLCIEGKGIFLWGRWRKWAKERGWEEKKLKEG